MVVMEEELERDRQVSRYGGMRGSMRHEAAANNDRVRAWKYHEVPMYMCGGTDSQEEGAAAHASSRKVQSTRRREVLSFSTRGVRE